MGVSDWDPLALIRFWHASERNAAAEILGALKKAMTTATLRAPYDYDLISLAIIFTIPHNPILLVGAPPFCRTHSFVVPGARPFLSALCLEFEGASGAGETLLVYLV